MHRAASSICLLAEVGSSECHLVQSLTSRVSRVLRKPVYMCVRQARSRSLHARVSGVLWKPMYRAVPWTGVFAACVLLSRSSLMGSDGRQVTLESEVVRRKFFFIRSTTLFEFVRTCICFVTWQMFSKSSWATEGFWVDSGKEGRSSSRLAALLCSWHAGLRGVFPAGFLIPFHRPSSYTSSFWILAEVHSQSRCSVLWGFVVPVSVSS